ncbi:NmrA family NAD(P)-binding protein [Acuticoccus sp. I52.16.1]|uniref:NmrA family NAD(P)-binding protein n=1 Tax=Acuticoccus sp. I52.16.1 TaxID=2928472 RepID=UPI001FCFA48A|nr:NmrA family NAD(P)-binding protein [Acuticoccus sp. I52.16.1]UOM34946.1 NmrA family NAD(P)-binding protein [Acuticoccus sp. I52.16.1]
MILVTAATGQVGNAALVGVAAAGVPVRALVREPSRHAFPAGVEIAAGSFEDEAALAVACEGVDVLLLAGRDGPDAVEQHRRVLDHAARAGVRHIVKLSAIGATAASPVALMREHHAVDELVQAGGFAWTFLEPHLFMQNLLRMAEAMRTEGRLAAPMGEGRYPLVDTSDVGTAAASVLVDPAAHAGKVYRLTGPAAVDYAEVAATFAAAVGRDVTYEAVSPRAFEARLLAAGAPGWRAYDLAHIAQAYAPAHNAVSDDLPSLLGRPATSLAAFVDRHRAALRN